MKGLDLELIRQIVADNRLHIMLALVSRVAVASDRSICRVEVLVLPEKRPLIATMTWDAVGAGAGFYMLPQVNDMVLVGQAEGDDDQAFVMRRLSSEDDKIPATAITGDMVAKALAGKKLWLTSDTRINISKGDAAPNENLVLGQVLKSVLSDFMAKYIAHKHMGNLGFFTAPPDNAADVTAKKADPVDNSKILSDIAFTEKGS